MDAPPADWLERVAESLCAHEDRRDTLLNFPPRYEMLEEISRGGMGIVYRAWDPQLGRNVALKVLRPDDGSTAEAHERFQREARLAASLHHPHIVPIHDTGTWNGQDYIAMQLIDGKTLEQAKPDRRTALACVRDAARALQYAHEQGIVHRDVKPSNLMLDAQRRLYIMDFGIARQAVSTSGMTSPGTVVGTPAYMSPEQAQGMPLDARSDVYSLGATLYELVTGRAPYQGEPLAVVEAVRTKDPDSARRLVGDLSKNVEAIIAGAMERRAQDRYPTAAALADDIDRYLAGERPLRRPRGLSYKVQREFVRHPWRATASIVFCLLLFLAGIVLGLGVRAYVYLTKARAEPTSQERRKKYLKIAESWFSEAGRELAAIQLDEDKAIAKENQLRLAAALEEQRRQEEKRTQEERRKNDANARRLQEEVDAGKRKELIRDTYDAALKALAGQNPGNARVPMESLKSAAPDLYQELLPKVLALEFTQGIEELSRFAATGNDTDFTRAFQTLSGTGYSSLTDRNPRLFKPVVELAGALKSKGRLRDGLHWFDIAEPLDAPEVSFYEERGLILLDLQEWDRAQKELDRLIAVYRGKKLPPPRFSELSYRKGREALSRMEWTQALTQFAIALQINPRHAKAFHDRGLARFRSAGLSRAALDEDLGDALKIDPDLRPDRQYREVAIAYSRAQAEEYWKADDAAKRKSAWEASLSWLTDIGRRLGEDPPLRVEKAKMHRRLRNYEQALTELQGLPDTPEKLRIQGQIRFEKAFEKTADAESLTAAFRDFDRAVQIDSQDAILVYWRGTCRHALLDQAKAMEDLKTAQSLGLDSADLHYQLSLVHQVLKEYAPAIEQAGASLARIDSLTEEGYIANLFEQRNFSRAAGIILLECEVLYCRATAKFQVSDFKSSGDDCNRILTLDPKNYNARVLRGEAFCKDQRHAEARKDYDEALLIAGSKEDRDRVIRLKSNCAKH